MCIYIYIHITICIQHKLKLKSNNHIAVFTAFQNLYWPNPLLLAAAMSIVVGVPGVCCWPCHTMPYLITYIPVT